ncbi:glutamate--tRNA ligase [Pseudomonadota bacterium]|jgi:glutamyl-tRNA synthetase|nr:glutamate--tRNA ligase [Pseudomonadota bacterium]
MESVMTKVTRFAPSPTGTLHIGGVRTALFNFVYSKQQKGKFLIRIEDTDAERSTREFEDNILKGLADMGIVPDETPVRQSERVDLYQNAIDRIINSGKAYYCDCSKERLDQMRSHQQAKGLKPQYDGKCRNLNLGKSKKSVLRLKTPQTGELIFHDLVRGEVIFQNSELDDLILVRSDGSPTYHFCNVIDDHDQGVTNVIRGEDHLSNTPRQIHIQQALELPALEYAHLPMVLGQDKKRLSKRNAVTSLQDYFDQGYLQSSMINMLARLGWSKGDKEIFYIDDLISDFRIQEVQKAGAIFDLAKLDWINNNHIAALSFAEFKSQLLPFLGKQNINLDSKENGDEILEAMRTSKPTLAGIAKDLRPYFFNVDGYDEKAKQKFLVGSENALEFIQRKLNGLQTWDESSIDSALADTQAALDLSTPKLNQPIRIAMTGSTQSPSLGLTLCLFGREESNARIQNALDHLKASSS